ncbi:hypothetical protein BgiBS90_031485 [Biomphalaria glabrata]|nr:hypothetical protein BgiBS90_031485 [Biomphalaria glabrata]
MLLNPTTRIYEDFVKQTKVKVSRALLHAPTSPVSELIVFTSNGRKRNRTGKCLQIADLQNVHAQWPNHKAPASRVYLEHCTYLDVDPKAHESDESGHVIINVLLSESSDS